MLPSLPSACPQPAAFTVMDERPLIPHPSSCFSAGFLFLGFQLRSDGSRSGECFLQLGLITWEATWFCHLVHVTIEMALAWSGGLGRSPSSFSGKGSCSVGIPFLSASPHSRGWTRSIQLPLARDLGRPLLPSLLHKGHGTSTPFLLAAPSQSSSRMAS